MRRWAVLHRRKRAQVRHQVAYVLDPHMREAGIGKHRIIMPARRRDAAQQGVGEIDRMPAADPILRIGRDVGDAKIAERRCEPQAAAEPQPVALAGRSVTGGAVALIEDKAAALRIAGLLNLRRLVFREGRARRGEEPAGDAQAKPDEKQRRERQPDPPIRAERDHSRCTSTDTDRISEPFGTICTCWPSPRVTRVMSAVKLGPVICATMASPSSLALTVPLAFRVVSVHRPAIAPSGSRTRPLLTSKR